MCHTPPRKSQGSVKQQGRAEGMSIVDREQMGIGPVRTAFAGIGKVLETVKAVAMAVLLRVLHAHQILLAEALVELDIELPVVAMIGSGSDPVVVNTVWRGDVRLWKETDHGLCDRVNQIACNTGSGFEIRR